MGIDAAAVCSAVVGDSTNHKYHHFRDQALRSAVVGDNTNHKYQVLHHSPVFQAEEPGYALGDIGYIMRHINECFVSR